MAVAAQNHIHLDTDLEGAPENSPTNKYKAIVPEMKLARAHIAMEYAVDATLMVHVVTSGGDPVISDARRYRFKVTRAELDTLLADLGKEVYFVPHYHPDDNSDHTAYRSQVRFAAVTEIMSREHANLATYYITIEIQED